jgi:pilus assembly protein CpaC
LLSLPQSTSRIFVADPAIADIQVPHPRRVFVFGKKPGRTTVFALDDEGTTIASFSIAVTYDDAALQRLLHAEFGDLPAALRRSTRGAVLTGTVPTADTAEKVRSAAAQFLAENEPLSNQLRVMGALQVNLRVRIAEVSRSAIKQLGVTWQQRVVSGPSVPSTSEWD